MAMRAFIYIAVMLAVALGLLLFEDVEVGLPVLNMAVWTVVAAAGLFLVTRMHNRSRRRLRSRSRSFPRNVVLRQPTRTQIDLHSQVPTIAKR